LVVVIAIGGNLVPAPIRRLWNSLFTAPARDTHGSARFGTAQNAARHLAPAVPADAFVLGTLRDAPRGADRRFRPGRAHADMRPDGAGKGIGAVIPNLLDYPGSAFVLGLKGENYALGIRRACGGLFDRLVTGNGDKLRK
jgi:type IV secretory pathway TraG/TraD family ATPase VirD4